MDEIRPFYHHVESCQETVPEAIIAFLEAGDFEDTVRNAVSIGGDTDTLAAIAGSIAEAFYGVPEESREECRKRIPGNMRKVLNQFDRNLAGSARGKRRQKLYLSLTEAVLWQDLREIRLGDLIP